MKIGVIVDGMNVARWQARALRELACADEIVLYNNRAPAPARRRLANALYYALNLFTVRNPLTRAVPLGGDDPRIVRIVDFEAERDGAWQRLPEALLGEIAGDRPAAIVKFGLNLLRVPGPDRLAAPILSYHHGDPELYRGRPAGFWELLHGRRTMGQMVQILSNRLDAGAVVAFAETKVHAHSYRATLIEAYRTSPLLLGRAIANAVAGTPVEKPVGGPNYRLPANMTVLRLIARLARRKIARLAYGALFEKRWQVSTAPATIEDQLPDPARWHTLPHPRGYTFLADPFFAPDGSLLVEALNAASGKGEILRLRDGEAPVRLSDPAVHHSYPAQVEQDGSHYVVPETAIDWAPRAHLWDAEWDDGVELDIAGQPRLVDPTFLRHEGRLYLFANLLEEGSGVLRLWMAPSLFGRFEEHPASPIRMSPLGSRMAGEIVAGPDGRLVRLGQDDSGGYGDGLVRFEIETLDPRTYSERLTGRLRFDGIKGPHTLNFQGGIALFDWYRERFSPLAGIRRLRGRLHAAAATPQAKKGQNL